MRIDSLCAHSFRVVHRSLTLLRPYLKHTLDSFMTHDSHPSPSGSSWELAEQYLPVPTPQIRKDFMRLIHWLDQNLSEHKQSRCPLRVEIIFIHVHVWWRVPPKIEAHTMKNVPVYHSASLCTIMYHCVLHILARHPESRFFLACVHTMWVAMIFA